MKDIEIFPWNDHFNTGLITVDEQHKKLVAILNNLARNIANNSSKDDLASIFEELSNYTIYHFETEEAIWHEYLPNDFLDKEHQKIHENFVDTIKRLKDEQSKKPVFELAQETLSFLVNWLASHILNMDRYMAYMVFALRDGLSLDAAKQDAKEKMSESSHFLNDIILATFTTLTSNTFALMSEMQSHKKLEKQIDDQNKYRDMFLELSTNFINLPLDRIDVNVSKALAKVAKFVGADRSYIFDYDFVKSTATNTYEWCQEGIKPQIAELKDIPMSFFEEWPKAHIKGEYILIKDVLGLPSSSLRDILVKQEIKSLITFPLFKNTECTGFIGFDSVSKVQSFSSNEIAILEIFSKLLNNVAERKQWESELSNERSLFKSLFQVIPDPMWIKDLNGVYLTCNPRFENFFGASSSQIIGKTDYDFVDKILADKFRLDDEKAIKRKTPLILEEKIVFANDGHEEILQTTKVPVYDKNGEIKGILGASRDITSIKNIQKKLEHKEHYQRALLDNFPFMIWLKDEENRILASNKTMAKACGFQETKDIIGKTNYDIWPEDIAYKYSLDDTSILLSGKSKTIEEIVETSDGKIWVETYKSPVTINNKVIGTVGFSKDITDRKKLEQNLIKERNLFENYLNTVESMIVSIDLKGYITLINRKACEILGYEASELIGQNWFTLCLEEPDGMQKVYPIFQEALKGNLEGYEYFENYVLTKTKEKYLIAWHNSYLTSDNGTLIGMLSSGEDITLVKEQQKRLEYMAHFDTLTNLPNRVLLSDRLQQGIIQAKRNKTILAIIYLDLDGFKEVNDTYGHANGDILLKIISNRIKEILHGNDTIARLGGDEFAIILHDLKTKEDCNSMLKRILSVVSTPVKFKDIEMQVSASMGVTYLEKNDTIDADQLLRQADNAMYQAKLAGKNRFNIFDVEKNESLRNHNEKLHNIGEALKNNEFIIYYQPKVNMKNGAFLGVEALIRWNHPTKGILTPGYFLPTIENHKLSVALDTWVIENVIKQIKNWKKENINIEVSINISAMKLQESDFINSIQDLVSTYSSVKTSDFTFEILETSALDDMNHISYIIKECEKIGINFSLDDFGTGYSSLSYLKNLPAKQLKIDQSFVRDMLIDVDDMAILEGVISLASAFRRDVIAEGVESIEQGQMLLRLGCQQAQGYIIAKPMPAEELLPWIKNWKSYEEWKNIEVLSRDDLPILYAITEHEIWIKEVIAYLRKEEDFLPELNYKQCRFGEWLYNKNYSNIKAFAQIENLHIHIHDNVNKIMKENLDQSEENIELKIKKILNCRDEFLKEFKSIFF